MYDTYIMRVCVIPKGLKSTRMVYFTELVVSSRATKKRPAFLLYWGRSRISTVKAGLDFENVFLLVEGATAKGCAQFARTNKNMSINKLYVRNQKQCPNDKVLPDSLSSKSFRLFLKILVRNFIIYAILCLWISMNLAKWQFLALKMWYDFSEGAL